MTDIEIRKLIIEALRYANVLAIRDNALVPAFLNKQADIPLAMLDMDSLAAMELCIAIELNSGVSIAPDALRELDTLARLAQKVCDEQH